MFRLSTFAMLLLVNVGLAQTSLNKSFPVKAGQKLAFNLEYPTKIKLHTWDKNEVSITGTVSINRGENDDAFEIVSASESNVLTITSTLKNKENLPQRLIIKSGDQEYYFKTKSWNDPEVQKFLEEHNGEYSYMSHGIIKEIELEINVPKGMETRVDAKYGVVEITNFAAPLTVTAKYGAVDATLLVAAAGEVIARTRYGEILTNLDIKFDQPWDDIKRDKWTEISSKPGRGPAYRFESKYGNIYLRKPN